MDREAQIEPIPPDSTLSPLDVRLAGLGDELRTAQAEIAQLQLEHRETKKPWWRQTAIIVSLVSLTLSTSFSIYTALDQIRQRKAAALDSRLADIVALRMEDARQAAALASTNLNAYRAWSSVAAVNRAMLIDALVSAVHDLHDDIGSTTAFAVGTELIQDGRYAEGKQMVEAGRKAAKREQSSAGPLTSLLAQLYMLQGSPFHDVAKGRELYHQAIDSFPNRADYSSLNRRLDLIQWWAAAEAGFGNSVEANLLIQLARQTLAASPLPPSVKAPLAGTTEAVANQIQQANAASLYDPSRLLGSWRVSGPESKKSLLTIAMAPGSAWPAFAKDQIEAGVLSNRINGNILINERDHMRMEWGSALIMNRGVPMSIAGYSDVRLQANGTLVGIDYPFGLPSKTWTAKKIQPVK
jgi:hypothetical protein